MQEDASLGRQQLSVCAGSLGAKKEQDGPACGYYHCDDVPLPEHTACWGQVSATNEQGQSAHYHGLPTWAAHSWTIKATISHNDVIQSRIMLDKDFDLPPNQHESEDFVSELCPGGDYSDLSSVRL